MQDEPIHWFSIINSLMIVVFLTGMVAMIMLRTLHRDIAKYNQLESAEEAQEETGWKLVHGDVFRPPPRASHLATYVGTGVQLLGMSIVTMVRSRPDATCVQGPPRCQRGVPTCVQVVAAVRVQRCEVRGGISVQGPGGGGGCNGAAPCAVPPRAVAVEPRRLYWRLHSTTCVCHQRRLSCEISCCSVEASSRCVVTRQQGHCPAAGVDRLRTTVLLPAEHLACSTASLTGPGGRSA